MIYLSSVDRCAIEIDYIFSSMKTSTDVFEYAMQTRKRVLINAFTVRALRDTFSPARGAGKETNYNVYLSVFICYYPFHLLCSKKKLLFLKVLVVVIFPMLQVAYPILYLLTWNDSSVF